MSFDLAVLAMADNANTDSALAMFSTCNSRRHPEGEPDHRIVSFYEELRSRFPDSPPFNETTPWMSMPLNTGIDHVIMHLSFSERSTPAIEAIMELANMHNLVLFDPQSDEARFPS